MTSIATVSTPRSRICASSSWSWSACGMVGVDVSTPRRASPTNTPSLPISPGVSPAARAMDASNIVVVVFPAVPVTPRQRTARDGSP